MIRIIKKKFFPELSKVAGTTAFRYSLLFTVAFSILTGVSMAVIYQNAAQEIAQQIDARLFSEASRLKRSFDYRRQMEMYTLVPGVTERISSEPTMSFCITPGYKLPEQYRPKSANNFVMLYTSFSDLCDINADHIDQGDESIRVIITPVSDDYNLIVGYDTRTQKRLLVNMLNIVYMVTGLMLIASFAGSFIMSRHITNSIARISKTARRIVDGDFSNRISISPNDSDELNQLSQNLNHMLDRIENLITSQRQVTNNIAHDLRSPLNRLRNRMEVALLDKKVSCDELRTVIAQSIEDAENLLRTFNALLNIAQVEARAKDDFTQTSVSSVCEDLAELYEVITEEGEHQFESDIEPHLHMMGNKQLIAQAITNLLDNAIKYTPNGGKITLSAKHNKNHIIVAVGDNGPGIPSEKYQDVLKRFVRLDNARSTPGNGLGLSLVSAVTALHGGTIQLYNNEPGLRIELWFPRSTQKVPGKLQYQGT